VKYYGILLHLCQVVKFCFIVLLSLLYKRLKSTEKQNFTTSYFIASLCIMG